MDEIAAMDLPFVGHYPALNKITGSTARGYLLSQILFLARNGKEFYKTDKEFCQYLEMGTSEFRAAKKWLVDSEMVIVTKRGIPSTSYYGVNMDQLTSLLKNYSSLCGESTSKQVAVSPSNSETEQRETEKDTDISAVQSEINQLPDFLGKTPLARLVSVYALKFHDLYGFDPEGMNWAMLGRTFKDTLTAYTEWQIAAMIVLHFDWHGASGEDDFTHARLADRCFPLEWIPKATNAYRAYLQNALGLEWTDDWAVKKWVVDIIKPLYQNQNGTDLG